MFTISNKASIAIVLIKLEYLTLQGSLHVFLTGVNQILE